MVVLEGGAVLVSEVPLNAGFVPSDIRGLRDQMCIL